MAGRHHRPHFSHQSSSRYITYLSGECTDVQLLSKHASREKMPRLACGGLPGGSAAAAQPGAARLARCGTLESWIYLDCCWKKEDKRRWECRYSNNKRRQLCTLSKELHLRSSSALNSAWSWRKPRRCGCDIAVCAATPTGFSRATGGPITTCWLSTLAFGALFTLRYDI